MTKRRPRRHCACGRSFAQRHGRHLSCARCSKAHRVGRRCVVEGCATCARAFARLDAFNARREPDNVCPCGCGVNYGAFRAGFTFTDARRDFISIPEDKGGKRRHGRRNQVLGLMKQWKRMAWDAMVGQHMSVQR